MLVYLICIATTIIVIVLLCIHKMLKESYNTMLYNLLEQTRTYGILIDRSNKITRISNAMCELLEVQHFELIGNHVSSIFSECDREQINKLLKNINQNHLETIDFLTLKTKTKQSHVLCNLASVEGLLHFHHKILIFQDRTSIVNNIKTLESSEKHLKEYADLFKSSFEDSFIPSIIVDEKYQIKNYNKSFKSLLRKQKIEVNYDSLYKILNIDENLLKSKSKSNKCFEITCSLNNVNKSLVFNTHKIQENKEHTYVLFQIQDITKQKTAESIRKRLEEKIIQTRKIEYLGELSGMISHEFNNALMPILSFSKSVEKSLPEKFSLEKDKLQKVITASNHAKSMIHQIMELKHIDFHKTEKIDLTEFLNKNMKEINIPSKIKVEVINNSLNSRTNANFEVLSKSFQNIINNSVNAMQNEKGEIKISLFDQVFKNKSSAPCSVNQNEIKPKRTYYALEIKDSRKVVNNHDISNIFNPQLNTTESNGHIDTGLTYVYNCTEKFNIPLYTKATPEEGVSLTFFFPKA